MPYSKLQEFACGKLTRWRFQGTNKVLLAASGTGHAPAKLLERGREHLAAITRYDDLAVGHVVDGATVGTYGRGLQAHHGPAVPANGLEALGALAELQDRAAPTPSFELAAMDHLLRALVSAQPVSTPRFQISVSLQWL